jgi:hypothetical protein
MKMISCAHGFLKYKVNALIINREMLVQVIFFFFLLFFFFVGS